MQSKYVLWKVSNGWILTYGNTIWEDADHLSRYAIFHSLKEFSDWAEKEAQPQPESKPMKVPNHGTDKSQRSGSNHHYRGTSRDKPKRSNTDGNRRSRSVSGDRKKMRDHNSGEAVRQG